VELILFHNQYILPYIPIEGAPCKGDQYVEYDIGPFSGGETLPSEFKNSLCFTCMHLAPIPEEFSFSAKIEINEDSYGKCIGADRGRWILSLSFENDDWDRC